MYTDKPSVSRQHPDNIISWHISANADAEPVITALVFHFFLYFFFVFDPLST
jgi:hypothetical protein